MDVVDRLGRRAVDTLGRLDDILQAARLPFAVIGASALLLHGVRLPRTTRDLDLAVTIDGGLTAVRTVLLNAGLAGTGIPHRFRTEDGSEIDVLAVDPSHEPPHEILVSDGHRIQGVGLAEAVEHAVMIVIPAHSLPVAPLPLIIAIKLWTAALGMRPDDLADACVAMESYELSGIRRFDIDYEQFGGLTFEMAGAFLAGLDAVNIATPVTRASIVDAIDVLLASDQFSDRLADSPQRRDLVRAYRTGIENVEKLR